MAVDWAAARRLGVRARERAPEMLPPTATDFSLLNGAGPLVAVLAVTVILFVVLVLPTRLTYDDDQGDGLTLVLLPKPRLPGLWEIPAFVAVFVALTVAFHDLQGAHSPDALYADLVARLANHLVDAPAVVSGLTSNFTLGLRFFMAATLVCLAVFTRGSLARHLLLLWGAVLYLAVMVFVDALLTAAAVVTGWPISPSTFLGNLAAILVGFLALARAVYANYAMPKPSAVPYVRRPRVSDTATLVGLTVAAAAICTAGLLLIYHFADPAWRPALALVLPVPFAQGAFVVRTVLLALVNVFTVRPEPPVGSARPPIDIIIPAYNEEEVIEATLESIDTAAGRYGGVVRVILVNDGSTDATKALAEATMARFRHATGRVYDGRHGGKSEALNAGLARATTDIVIRIDADTIVGEWSLYYTPRWFDDPDIGLVEAMMFPRWRKAFYPRMRLFEELKQFGMTHYTIQTVDGVNVVPGVFTAFRRSVAVELGGFTVGMNGEDGDFTLRFGRMGYRSWMDPKIVIYEDVPGTYLEIREQRVRWSRAIFHNQARNGPYRAGLASAKVWYSQTHQFFKITFAPARLMLPVYFLLAALFSSSERTIILVFLGAYVVAQIIFMAREVVLAAGYHQLKHLGWVLVWPLWQQALLVFSTEAWLSLPPRPAGLRGVRPTAVAAPVIH